MESFRIIDPKRAWREIAERASRPPNVTEGRRPAIAVSCKRASPTPLRVADFSEANEAEIFLSEGLAATLGHSDLPASYFTEIQMAWLTTTVEAQK